MTWKWLAGTLVTVVFALVVYSANVAAEKTRELQKTPRENAERIDAISAALAALEATQRELAVKLDSNQRAADARTARIEATLDRLEGKLDRLTAK